MKLLCSCCDWVTEYTTTTLFLRSSIERDKIKQFQIRTYQPAAPFQGKPIPAVDSPAHNPLMMKESKRKQKTENKAQVAYKDRRCV
jgi:hypothetical protein